MPHWTKTNIIKKLHKMPPKKSKSLPPLPGPVLHIIFQQLRTPELRSCRLVCRLWKQVITFYHLIPDVADFFIDCRSLIKKPWNLKRSLLKIIRPGLVSPTSKFYSLQENYLQNCGVYFIRWNPDLRIRGFEELSTFSNFFAPSSLPFLVNISTLTLEAIDGVKFQKMNLQHFSVLISHLPFLQRLTLPLRLLSVFEPPKWQKTKKPDGELPDLFYNLEFLQIQLPTLSIHDEDEDEEFVRLISKVAVLFGSGLFPFLEHLSLSSEPYTGEDKNRSLKSPEMDAYYAHITKILNILGDSLDDNLAAMVLSMFELTTFSVSNVPGSVFENSGFLGLFAYLGMRGLSHLDLSVTASTLETSLPTMLQMILNYGCEVDLHLEFYLQGTESQLATQYLLSLPEICESLSSLTLRFLGDYDGHNHMFFLEDFIPFHTRLNGAEGPVDFKKLTTFKILFERPTHKAFLTFGWLNVVWPHLTHITIIVGKPETYQSERGIAWGLLKDKWKGRRNTSVSNVFYLRGIIKFFPQLETLVFWADLQKVSDSLIVPTPILGGSCERRGLLSHSVPELEELSLRGLGPRITNDCIRGFYGMKKLASLELIGNHSINNSVKSKLLEETPSLKQFKFNL